MQQQMIPLGAAGGDGYAVEKISACCL